jgi:hypothetical protein
MISTTFHIAENHQQHMLAAVNRYRQLLSIIRSSNSQHPNWVQYFHCPSAARKKCSSQYLIADPKIASATLNPPEQGQTVQNGHTISSSLQQETIQSPLCILQKHPSFSHSNQESRILHRLFLRTFP